jgi:hypothetical protein
MQHNSANSPAPIAAPTSAPTSAPLNIVLKNHSGDVLRTIDVDDPHETYELRQCHQDDAAYYRPIKDILNDELQTDGPVAKVQVVDCDGTVLHEYVNHYHATRIAYRSGLSLTTVRRQIREGILATSRDRTASKSQIVDWLQDRAKLTEAGQQWLSAITSEYDGTIRLAPDHHFAKALNGRVA